MFDIYGWDLINSGIIEIWYGVGGSIWENENRIYFTSYSLLIYSQIEYFIYFNMWLMSFIYWMFLFSSFIISCIYIISSLYNMDGFIEYCLLVIYVLLLMIIIGQGFIILLNLTFLSYFSISGICICMNGIQWSWIYRFIMG